MDKASHLLIQGVQDMVPPLDQRDMHPGMDKVLGNLKADESTADDNSFLDFAFLQEGANGDGILDGLQLEDTIRVLSQMDGLSTGRKDQLVVAIFEYFPGFKVLDLYRMSLPIDGKDFVIDMDKDVEAGLQAFRCLKGEIMGIKDDGRNIIGKTTVGIGNEMALLIDNDLCLFRKPSKTAGEGGTTGNTAYNDVLHTFSFRRLFSSILPKKRQRVLLDALPFSVPEKKKPYKKVSAFPVFAILTRLQSFFH